MTDQTTPTPAPDELEDQIADEAFDQANTPAKEDPDEDFGALLEEYLPDEKPKGTGELIDCTVVGIVDDVVLVGYGSKEEVGIPLHEFLDAKGQPTVKAGDGVRCVITGYRGGSARLSYREAREASARKMLEETAGKRVPVRGSIKRSVKGGLVVDVGMDAFMPASQADVYRVGDLESLVGMEIEAFVIEFDPRRGRAVLSRRQLLEDRRNRSRTEFMDRVKAGEEIEGTVKDVLDFGVFIQFGDVEGLIPRSELSWDRAINPAEVAKVGETLRVKVLEVDPGTGKITLSRKRLDSDPWEHINDVFPIGSVVNGTVSGVQSFGAFVTLQEGVTGLLHASDVSWEAEGTNAEEKFKVGDSVSCQVTEIDSERKRLSLSLKHLTRDPWSDVQDRFPEGSKQKGTVTGLRPFGAFVRLDEYTEGLVHISDFAWKKRYNHANEMLKEGEQVEVIVLSIDKDRRRIGLGIKQLERSPMDAFIAEHPVNSLVTGTVTKFTEFGAFVEVAPGLEGLLHVSEIDEGRVESPQRVLKQGEEVTVMVIQIDAKRERISLSRRKALRKVERENIERYMKKDENVANVGGGIFGAALQNALKKKD